MLLSETKDKYPVSAMCNVLKLSRSTYYYEAKERNSDDEVTHAQYKPYTSSCNELNR
jgi:hypothetical protein